MRVGLIENLPNIGTVRTNGIDNTSLADLFSAVGGNSGNIAYVEGVHNALAHDVIVIDWSTPDDVIQKTCDLVVIACANQLGEHADLGGWATKLEAIGLPVVLVGLGAQSADHSSTVKLPDGTMRFLRVVNQLRANEAACNVGVRGDFSRSVVEAAGGDAIKIGCPSLFVSTDQTLGKTISGKAKDITVEDFILSSGNPYLASSVKAEINLCKLAIQSNARYVVQHPIKMIGLATNKRDEISDVDVEVIRKNTAPQLTLPEFRDWCKTSWDVYIESRAWMDALRRSSCVVGARYHGVALGVQAGIPACVIVIDGRTRELATTTGVPFIEAKAAESENNLEFVKSLWSEQAGNQFDRNRYNLARVLRNFLSAQGLKASDNVVKLASQTN